MGGLDWVGFSQWVGYDQVGERGVRTAASVMAGGPNGTTARTKSCRDGMLEWFCGVSEGGGTDQDGIGYDDVVGAEEVDGGDGRYGHGDEPPREYERERAHIRFRAPVVEGYHESESVFGTRVRKME